MGRLDWQGLLKSTYAWSVVGLAVLSVLFISAAFLVVYSHKAGDQTSERFFRRVFQGTAFPTVAFALVSAVLLRDVNAWHFDQMVAAWPWWALSLIAFGLALYWTGRGQAEVAFFSVVAQYGLAFWAYGASRYPYLLYPDLTLYSGFTHPTMARALLLGLLGGLLLLIPSGVFALRLFVLNEAYARGALEGEGKKNDNP